MKISILILIVVYFDPILLGPKLCTLLNKISKNIINNDYRIFLIYLVVVKIYYNLQVKYYLSLV